MNFSSHSSSGADAVEAQSMFRSLDLEDEEEEQVHPSLSLEPIVWRGVVLDDEDDYIVGAGPASESWHDSLDGLAMPTMQSRKSLHLNNEVEEKWDEPRHTYNHNKQKDFGLPDVAPLGDIVAAVDPCAPKLLEVQEEPLWVEPWTTFLSNTLPQALLDQVGRILERNQHIEHEVHPNQALISGLVSNDTGACVKFQLSIYARSKGGYMAEMQRRSGCIVAFSCFYRSFVQQLGQHVRCQLADADVADAASVAPAPAAQPAQSESWSCGVELPPALPEYDHLTVSPETVASICSMAKREEQDLSSEGMRALAGVSQQACNISVLAKQAEPILDLLSCSLRRGGDISHAAGALLKNLVSDETMVRAMSPALLNDILAVLEKPTTLENRQVKRNLALALSHIGCTTHKVALSKHRARLQKSVDASSDPKCKALLQQTLAAC